MEHFVQCCGGPSACINAQGAQEFLQTCASLQEVARPPLRQTLFFDAALDNARRAPDAHEAHHRVREGERALPCKARANREDEDPAASRASTLEGPNLPGHAVSPLPTLLGNVNAGCSPSAPRNSRAKSQQQQPDQEALKSPAPAEEACAHEALKSLAQGAARAEAPALSAGYKSGSSASLGGHAPTLSTLSTASASHKSSKSSSASTLSQASALTPSEGAAAAAPPPLKFRVRVTKSPDLTKLGVETVALSFYGERGALKVALKVAAVKSRGLISEWNCYHKTRQVKESDLITEVNGVSGSCDELYRVIAQDNSLEILVLRVNHQEPPHVLL